MFRESEDRPTEATVASRMPPRLKFREHMSVELPHITVLIDDPEKTVMVRLFSQEALEGSRQFTIFLSCRKGGSIAGQWITDAAKVGKISDAMRGLGGKERFHRRYALPSDRAELLKPLLFADVDGNHAKTYWEQKSAGASDDQPARFALVQLQHPPPSLQRENRGVPRGCSEVVLGAGRRCDAEAHGKAVGGGARTLGRVRGGGPHWNHGAHDSFSGAPCCVADGLRRPAAGGAQRGEDRLCPRRGGHLILPAMPKDDLFFQLLGLP